jgi:multidrug efflux pump subunit AcrA (membrane-fusion protein)
VKAAKSHVELTVTSVNSGTVKAEREAELAFGTVGRVSKNNAHVGMQVKTSAVLAELENIDLSTVFEMSSHDMKRSIELLKTHAVSTQQMEQVQRAYDLAESAYEKSLIRAPFDGLITEVNLEIGQLSQITAVIPKPLI